MKEFEQELSDAIGQRNIAWHHERLGRFTSSRFGDLMRRGKASTKQMRASLTKGLKCGDITDQMYKAQISEIEALEYESNFGDACKTYVYEKIGEILTQSVHDSGGSAATEWGNDQEAHAVNWYIEKTGEKVEPMGFVKFGELAGGSPDGKKVDRNGILEIKCPFNPANHIRTLITEQVPSKYFYQVHGNIMVTDSDHCDFISFDPRMQDDSLKMVIIRVDRDESVIQEIKDRIQEVADYMRALIEKYK